MQLQNNTILVTGGTGGFGYLFASKLLALGNTVIITGRNADKLAETKKLLPAVHTIQSDVSKPEDIAKLYAEVVKDFPKLNILINNAGEMRNINLHHNYTLDNITREIDINLNGPIRMVQQFLPHLKKQGHAAILNVTSGIALLPFAISPIYGASKAGLRSYTQALRIQLKQTNIKVFELTAPGAATTLSDKFKDAQGFDASILMAPDKVIDSAIKGMERDRFEIYPGLARVMYIVSRLAPKLAIAQLGKIGTPFTATKH